MSDRDSAVMLADAAAGAASDEATVLECGRALAKMADGTLKAAAVANMRIILTKYLSTLGGISAVLEKAEGRWITVKGGHRIFVQDKGGGALQPSPAKKPAGPYGRYQNDDPHSMFGHPGHTPYAGPAEAKHRVLDDDSKDSMHVPWKSEQAEDGQATVRTHPHSGHMLVQEHDTGRASLLDNKGNTVLQSHSGLSPEQQMNWQHAVAYDHEFHHRMTTRHARDAARQAREMKPGSHDQPFGPPKVVSPEEGRDPNYVPRGE